MSDTDPRSPLERIILVIQQTKKHQLRTLATHIKDQQIESGFSAILGAWNTRIAELDEPDHGVTKFLDDLRFRKEAAREIPLGRFEKNPGHP